ncbi:MAG: ATP-binding protein [Gemmatimonadales bacterium]
MATNPSPCGFLGDASRQCSCSPAAVQRYRARISGPLLDRVDIHMNVPPVAYDDLAGRTPREPSAVVRARVEAARERQLQRLRQHPGIFANAHMGPRELAKFVRVDAATEQVLKTAIVKLGLSARAYHRVLKLARTLADLEGRDDVTAAHVGEAIQYRVLDRG